MASTDKVRNCSLKPRRGEEKERTGHKRLLLLLVVVVVVVAVLLLVLVLVAVIVLFYLR